MSIFKHIFDLFIIIKRVIPNAKSCTHQPPTRGDNTVSVAKQVLPSRAPPAAFATGQCMKTNGITNIHLYISRVI